MSEGREVQWWISPRNKRVSESIIFNDPAKGAPRALIYRIVRKGEVRVNKKRVKWIIACKRAI